LRSREQALDKYLRLFLDCFNSEQPLKAEGNFRLLLELTWLINSFIFVRLKLNPKWMKKQWFLDLLDVDDIKIKRDEVEIVGDIVWWAEGKDAVGKWWLPDHEPHWTGTYKVKIRGDLAGGYWVVEPVIANLQKAKFLKKNAAYEIEFGKGSTYMKVRSR